MDENKDPKLDSVQMQRQCFDSVAKANRVKLTDTEMSMELSHEDGDSITSHPATLVANALGVSNEDAEVLPPLNISSMKRYNVYVFHKNDIRQGKLDIMVSPMNEGDVWFRHLTISMNSQMENYQTGIQEILGRRIKILSEDLGESLLDIHFLAQG